ncbi:hypothetical protein [Pseudomonas tussilaginis]|uniref:hypothetical protein n=1 Tax=Pseudomonas putida TaxID=303 RepID=UPI000FAC18A5|nr:hypothetical protein [Pseudomonas putida]MDD1976956.1 hypothetical protein [Pseudomonas putida]
MDAKSLQTLQQLKAAMESSTKEVPITAPHVPGQGFSVESEKFFSEIAAKKRDEIDRALGVSRKECESSSQDPLILELRKEFAALRTEIELQDIARREGKEKQLRKVAKAIRKESRKAEKRAARKAHGAPKRTKPSTPICPEDPGSKWIQKVCWRCKSKFVIHADWENPPSLCKVCAKDLRETHLPTGPDRSTPFRNVYFVRGGAPGLGKRR